MDIRKRTVLVLGGGGLVGLAICRKLVSEGPRRVIVAALTRAEAEDGVRQLRKEFPRLGASYFTPWWGNIFVRAALKDTDRSLIVNDSALRSMLIADMLDELTDPVLRRSAIFQLVNKYKPDIIIDCINSATGIAYQDIFNSARRVLQHITKVKSRRMDSIDGMVDGTERLLSTLYIPQLIRHVQILYQSMHRSGTKIYVKIGTSGTGGMGLNIPYTHSEEKPSSVLLSKSAVAGAHTLLLFLMGRTPDAPITKEIKPTAAIAWKRVAYGEIKKRGKAISLVDCPVGKGVRVGTKLTLSMPGYTKPTGKTLKSVFIDTGENGLFSHGEFEAITSPGQMEFVTPEEIAEGALYEIRGGNTGHDIINALDNATLGPTYRAGYLFQNAKQRILELEKKHGSESVAFEMLGPPRLSKILYEAHLLRLCCKDMRTVLRTPASVLSKKVTAIIKSNTDVRSKIVSIGIPILMPDGKTILRGDEIKIPPYQGSNVVDASAKSVNLWAHDGWVDLRTPNMQLWKLRLKQIKDMAEDVPADDTSSRFQYTTEFWNDFREMDPGKLAGWIFNYEERGMRMKA
jgi:hypothetical protein